MNGALPFATLAFAIALLPATAPAQDPPPSTRPTIGLVLSGGGARGLAHVGVLEVLEELRVPVDLIAGTSMGALVGGLYASGLSPDSIRTVMSEVEWDQVLSDTAPLASLDFARRAERRRYPVELEVGLSGEGIRLPGGLIAGQDLGLLLRRHTFPVAAVEDFSRLPIPFAAVATDLATGERVVLDHGDLVEAMRASMAIPVVFSPVESEGRLLVDGGIVDNLPVDLAREMGADIVIAVDASPPLHEEERLRGIIGVFEQLVHLLSRQNVTRQLQSADIRIELGLQDVEIFHFRKADEIVTRGEEVARESATQLTLHALPPEIYEMYQESRAARRPTRSRSVSALQIQKPSWIDERRIRRRIGLRPGDPLDLDELEEAVHEVYSIGGLEQVGYDLEVTGDSTTVVLRAQGKTQGPSTLRFGLDLVTDSGAADFRTGLVTFTATTAYTRSRIGARGAEWRTEVRVGQRNSLESALRQPLDFSGRWFLEPLASLSEDHQPVYADERLASEYEVRRGVLTLDVGRTIGRTAEIRVGVATGRTTTDLLHPLPGSNASFPEIAEDVGELRGAFAVDRLDAVNLPRRGVYADLEIRTSRKGLGGERDWSRTFVSSRGFWSRGPNTFFAAFAGGSSSRSGLPTYEEFRLGGFGSLSGFGDGELRGEEFAVARVGYLTRITEVPPALRAVLVGGWLEAGDAWRHSDDDPLDRLHCTATAAVGVETIIGPIFAAWARADEGRGRLYVSLGRSP